MGTWGTALFADDTAADVRDTYRDLIGDGLTSAQATDALVAAWGDAFRDPDEASVFWLALAAVQWQVGRLEPRVKSNALTIIEEDSDLARWRDQPKLLKTRKAVLEKLRVQLLSPQPPEKRIRRRYRSTCDWEPGEVVAYRLQSGRLVLFWVLGIHKDAGGESPVCELLDWSGCEQPSTDAVDRARAIGRQFMLGRLKEKDFPADRVIRLGIKREHYEKPRGYTVLFWTRLDQDLQEILGVT